MKKLDYIILAKEMRKRWRNCGMEDRSLACLFLDLRGEKERGAVGEHGGWIRIWGVQRVPWGFLSSHPPKKRRAWSTTGKQKGRKVKKYGETVPWRRSTGSTISQKHGEAWKEIASLSLPPSPPLPSFPSMQCTVQDDTAASCTGKTGGKQAQAQALIWFERRGFSFPFPCHVRSTVRQKYGVHIASHYIRSTYLYIPNNFFSLHLLRGKRGLKKTRQNEPIKMYIT